MDYNTKFNITDAKRKQSGTYKIIATNQHGKDEAEVEIVILGELYMKNCFVFFHFLACPFLLVVISLDIGDSFINLSLLPSHLISLFIRCVSQYYGLFHCVVSLVSYHSLMNINH